MLGKILNITSLQNPIIKDLTKIIRSNNQKEIKSFICEGNFFLKSAFENKWEIHTLVINSNISYSTEITKIIKDKIYTLPFSQRDIYRNATYDFDVTPQLQKLFNDKIVTIFPTIYDPKRGVYTSQYEDTIYIEENQTVNLTY